MIPLVVSDEDYIDHLVDERNAAEARADRALVVIRRLRARYQRRLGEEAVRVETYKQALQCLFETTADALAARQVVVEVADEESAPYVLKGALS